MTTFSVTIPEDKTSFFLEFLELIGGKFDVNLGNFELSDDQKSFLLKQNDVSIEDCINIETSFEKLKTKHEL